MKKSIIIQGIIVVLLAGSVSAFTCGNSVTFTYRGSLVTYGTVSHNGECWLARNLGASTDNPTSYDDPNGYGDLFQWGRLDDGHQDRSSGTTSTCSSGDNPGHNNFITASSDWRCPSNNELWLDVSGTNNPCPPGWRIPMYYEWQVERASWSSDFLSGAYASPLQLTAGGFRVNTNGVIAFAGTRARYWGYGSSSIGYSWAIRFYISPSTSIESNHHRAMGQSVRCIWDPKLNGDSCSSNNECESNYCKNDLDGDGKLCVDSNQCVYSDTLRDNSYLTCYNDDSYTCNSGTWINEDCGTNTACGYYKDISSVCSAGSCIPCPTSCTNYSDCDDGMFCVENSCLFTILPTYSNFESSYETTNFSDVNLSSVTSLILAIDNKGKIKFPESYGINTGNENYDANVKIEDALIYVNSAALDSSFNSSATLTFENVNCNFPYVYYSETASTRLAILTENNQCLSPRCTNIQCSDGTLIVAVSHFSGYAVNGNASLAIDADDPKYPSQEMHFTADYRNSTNGFISGATCTIYLPDGSNPMDEGTEIYTYNQTYDAAQTIEYNVTCNKTGHSTVTANDTALVSDNVPEFSTITLGLGLIAVLGGLIVIRRKK